MAQILLLYYMDAISAFYTCWLSTHYGVYFHLKFEGHIDQTGCFFDHAYSLAARVHLCMFAFIYLNYTNFLHLQNFYEGYIFFPYLFPQGGPIMGYHTSQNSVRDKIMIIHKLI